MSRINPEGEDITHLRSFLDLNTRKRGWRKTRKGSGEVAWTVHQHNSKTEALADIPLLRRAAYGFFSSRTAEYPPPLVVTPA